MELRETSAIILKSVDWSETSKILTCFSESYGKISLLARGAKRPKSHFRGLCEPLNEVEFIYDHKSTRDVDIIREMDLKHNLTDKISNKFNHLYYSLALTELIDRLIQSNDVNKDVYCEFKSLLRIIKDIKHPESYFFKFYLTLISHLGYHFDFKTCGSCHEPLIQRYQYQIAYGVVCNNCENSMLDNRMSQQMFACFDAIQTLTYNTLDKVSINIQLQKEMLNILHDYIAYHLGIKLNLKSLSLVLNT